RSSFGTDLATWCIEREEGCIRGSASPERVKSAAILIAISAYNPFVVAVRIAPNTIGLKRKDAWAANLKVQEAAYRQSIVAHHFCFEAKPRATSQQAVVRIALNEGWRS